MNIYPALRSQMGSFTYYTVKMSARELSENVKFAYEVYEDRTLDQAIQRILNEGRVKKEIVEYLKNQPDRFFSSVVVAALEGEPLFYPVEITEDPQFAIFRDDQRLNEAFGVLKFDGNQKYYVLDGQHRLSAIKTLLDRSDPLSGNAPRNFENDEFSVIVIVPNQQDSTEDFMLKYRRLFSNLNRYAKATDTDTNIIMDEDDIFAIITRRLITENAFFQSPGRQRESIRIKTKGKNLTKNDPHFTSLSALYDMNIALLSSSEREPGGWGPIRAEGQNLKSFMRFRPSEEYIDKLYAELVMYWEALLAEIPDLRKEPSQMRVHELEEVEDEDETDHLLFWPIGQQMLAEIVRELLNIRLPDIVTPTSYAVSEALKGLGQLEWRLHQAPWRYLFLVRNASDKWAMRNEARKEAIRCGRRIQQWVIGLDALDKGGVENLRTLWESMLIPAQSPEVQDKMWQQVKKMKSAISG